MKHFVIFIAKNTFDIQSRTSFLVLFQQLSILIAGKAHFARLFAKCCQMALDACPQ